jgi:hypothetical protein
MGVWRIARLLAGGHQFVFKGLEDLHGVRTVPYVSGVINGCSGANALKDGYAVRAILPRRERRGLTRIPITSGSFAH